MGGDLGILRWCDSLSATGPEQLRSSAGPCQDLHLQVLPATVPVTEEAANKCKKPQMRDVKGSGCPLKKVHLVRYKLVTLRMQPLYSQGLAGDEASP